MDLTTIAPGDSLESGAAASFERMASIRPGLRARINSAYRTPEHQDALRAKYLANPNKYPFALPASKSLHCKGLALDIDSDPANADHAWLVANGAQYGWRRTNKAEPWHFEYDASTDTRKDDDMATPAEVWGYKNPASKGGTEDVYLHVRSARWAAEDAAAGVKALAASIKAPAPATVDLDALAAKVAALVPSIDYAKLAKAVNDDAATRRAGWK